MKPLALIPLPSSQLCSGPVPLSNAQMNKGAREVTEGAVEVPRFSCVCHHSSLLACPPQPHKTPLVAWHLPAFALETINSVLVPQCTFTHHRNCTINTFSREKATLRPEQQSLALRIIHPVL